MDLDIKKAFILAGGRGERLGDIGKNTPKVMLKVQQKPLLQWNIELCRQYGIKEIVLGTGFLHEQIESFFGNGKNFGVRIEYSIEDTFLGTAGALKLAERFFENEKKFVMMNGDEVKDVRFDELNRVFETQNAWAADALVTVADVSQYGSVRMKNNRITAFLEKSQSQNQAGLVNAGAYILSNLVFSLIREKQPVSIEKDVFPMLARKNRMVGIECLGQWFPTDSLERLQTAQNKWTTRFEPSV